MLSTNIIEHSGRSSLISMKKVSYKEYLEFISRNDEIVIGDSVVKLEPIKVARLHPLPEELSDISTTVWSFPKRGAWATHRGDYRGNWPPQVARALILMYTEPGDTVLDPMVGGGTTCIEAKLLGRNCIGVDINYNAVMLTLHRLYWLEKALEEAAGQKSILSYLGQDPANDTTIDDIRKARIEIYHGDARNLDAVSNSSIDLVATHPPYFNIIRYSRRGKTPGDLSAAKQLEDYLRMLRDVAREAYRVLKPGHHIGMLLGDTRVHKHYVPITHYALQLLLDTGFILKEEIIKIQHKMKTTREKWAKLTRDFLLIYHEKLFIMRKPSDNKEYKKYKYSAKQPWLHINL